MDILAFFMSRTAFIRQFYETAAFAFTERKRKIEEGEEPFEPPYSEDGEPPFLGEWIDAGDSINILGQVGISLLAPSLQLYFKEWIRNSFLRFGDKAVAEIKDISKYKSEHKKSFKDGWLNGYKEYIESEYDFDWSQCPADIDLLEEAILARNRIQHPECITTIRVHHSESDLKKMKGYFFIRENEFRLMDDTDSGEMEWIFPPEVSVNKDRLYAAISEAEKLCQWLEDEQTRWGKAVWEKLRQNP